MTLLSILDRITLGKTSDFNNMNKPTKNAFLEKYDRTESRLIARIVLQKIGLTKNSGTSPLTKSKTLKKTLDTVEGAEKKWMLKLSGSQLPSYGRKSKNETIRFWSVGRKTAEVLESLVALRRAKTVLEIGTSAGYSTLFLANGVRKQHGQVYTIESLPQKVAIAKENFKKAGLNNITLIAGDALSVLSGWRHGKVDFVFLDADKERYGMYLQYLLPIMNKDALIVADNINDYGHLMEDYLQKVSGTHLPKSRTDKRVKSYYLAALENGLMITRKIVR